MTDRATEMRRAALDYIGRGWSAVVLRPRDKYPLIRWEPYQYRAADPAEVQRWFDRWPDANVGIVTGQVLGPGGAGRRSETWRRGQHCRLGAGRTDPA